MACRQPAEQRSTSADDRSESEQLLSAVLRSSGDDRPATDDGRTSADAADRSESVPSDNDSHRPSERTGASDEQIMLRELDPAQQAAATIETTPPKRESSVAASLLQAFGDGADPTRSTTATASSAGGPTTSPDDDAARASAATDEVPVLDTPGDGGPGPVRSEADTARGDVAPDAGDADRPGDHEEAGATHPDPAELHTTDHEPTGQPQPDATDREPTGQPQPDATDHEPTGQPQPDATDREPTGQPQPDATDREPTDHAEPPGAVHPDSTAASQPADASAGIGDAENPSSESDEAPETPETEAAEPPEAAETSETSETSEPAEAPARTGTSEASETPEAAEPPEAPETPEAAERSETSDDGGSSATVAPSPPAPEDSATVPSTDNSPDGQPPSAAPEDDAKSSSDVARGDSNTERESLRSRLRTIFREMGAWTTVAQFALLITGLLCVFQVVVLLVVLRFLLQSSTQDATTAANMLVAHGRAINGMLPALVAGALIVAVAAIWHARGARDRVPHGTRLFHVPVSLWAMIAAASAVAAVVVVDTSSTVEQAAQTTLYAITACAVLGATAFIAPRSIAVAAPTTSESTAARDHAGTSRNGHVPPRAEPALLSGQPTTPRGDSEPPDDASAGHQTTAPDDKARVADEIAAPNAQAAQPQSDAQSIPDRDESADASEASAA